MKSWVRHFILGCIIGVISIIALYAIFNSVVVNKNEINSAAAIVVILCYGVGTALLGEFLLMFDKKKK